MKIIADIRRLRRQFRSFLNGSLLIALLLGVSISVEAQQEFTGKVTYVTSQHIYARFDGVNDLLVGDTIFVHADSQLKPLMVIESKSSYSAVGKPFPGVEVTLGQEVVGRSTARTKTEVKDKPAEPVSTEEVLVTSPDSTGPKQKAGGDFSEKVRGWISLSSRLHRLQFQC